MSQEEIEGNWGKNIENQLSINDEIQSVNAKKF